MNGLTPDELIPGEYYQCQEGDFVMVFQFKEQNKTDKLRPITEHCITSEGKYFQNSPIWISDRNCRFATSEEIKLLFNEIEENKRFLDKNQNDLTLDDFYHGQEFKCEIMGTPSKGLVSINEDGKIYLCQNQVEGSHIEEKFGYDYSWQITIIENQKNKLALRHFNIEVENLQLEKPKTIDSEFPTGLLYYIDHAYKTKSSYLSIDGLDDQSDERVEDLKLYPQPMMFIEKEQHQLEFEDFYHGQYFTCEIDGVSCAGKVTIDGDSVFLCQSQVEGFECTDKQSFKHSYIIMEDRKWIKDGEECEMKVEKLKISKRMISMLSGKSKLADDHFGTKNQFIYHDLVVEGLSDEDEDWLLSNYTQDLSFLRINERPQHPQRQLVFRFKVEASNESREHIRNQIKLKGGNSKETLSSIDTQTDEYTTILAKYAKIITKEIN